MVLVTRQAPDLPQPLCWVMVRSLRNSISNSTPTVNLPFCSSGRWTSPSCPSELIAFDKRYEEFQKRGVEVVGVSFDSSSCTTHGVTPGRPGGIGPVKYAMVADIKREIQKAYGIEHPDEGVAARLLPDRRQRHRSSSGG